MNPRIQRFIGTGNTWIGEGANAYRAWRLECSLCHETKIIGANGHSMSPEWLLKKFQMSGWEVGKKPGRDLCSTCSGSRTTRIEPVSPPAVTPPSPPPEPKEPAVQIVATGDAIRHDINEPVINKQASDRQQDVVRVRKAFLRELNASLHTIRTLIAEGEDSRADDYLSEAIAALEKYIATAQKKTTAKTAPPPMPITTETDSDYASWLAEQEKECRSGLI